MKRNASGAGSIRQRPDGRWEARYTAGVNPGTGKQIQKSVYGATQDEVVKKLRKVLTEMDGGVFVEPSKMTVGAWLDVWTAEYLGGVKTSTQISYKGHVKRRIKPALGAVKLQKMKPHQVQAFYNALQLDGVSAKTVRNIHGILHSALKQAVKLGYLNNNPSEMCALPRVTKKQVKVLEDGAVPAFLAAIEGHQYGVIYFVCLFTGMRISETLGLTWDAVDFDAGALLVSKQLAREKGEDGTLPLDSTKTDRVRKINPAPVVMNRLKERQRQQIEHRLRAGPAWDNAMNLVFTDEIGQHHVHQTVYKNYKRIVAALGYPELRLHDLRHSYAVISIMSGDDVKTVQENLGHSTITTTLDVYGHVTDRMREDSAARMQAFIDGVQKNKA